VRILVVDDDLAVRECMQDVLEVAVYAVSTASNGREALELLTRIDPPCLILLDLMMPIMSGSEFLWVRRERDVPVVIVSAWPKEAAQAEGVQGIVEKPVNLDDLLNVVREYC
jgi:CheY-like chemotaxis protein